MFERLMECFIRMGLVIAIFILSFGFILNAVEIFAKLVDYHAIEQSVFQQEFVKSADKDSYSQALLKLKNITSCDSALKFVEKEIRGLAYLFALMILMILYSFDQDNKENLSKYSIRRS
jgi:hypothetical protein